MLERDANTTRQVQRFQWRKDAPSAPLFIFGLILVRRVRRARRVELIDMHGRRGCLRHAAYARQRETAILRHPSCPSRSLRPPKEELFHHFVRESRVDILRHAHRYEIGRILSFSALQFNRTAEGTDLDDALQPARGDETPPHSLILRSPTPNRPEIGKAQMPYVRPRRW